MENEFESESKNKFGKRLENLLDEYNLSQTELSENLSTISNFSLSSYITGRRIPRIDTIIEICEYFDVTLDYMFGRSDTRKPISQMVVEMPIYKTFNIGQNNFSETNVETYLPVAKERFDDVNNLFGYRIKSNKMNPRFYKGDIAIVKRTKEVTTGDIVMITIGNDEAIIRELITTNNG